LPRFTPLLPGTNEFSLIVNDGLVNSPPDSIKITVNDATYIAIQSPNGGEVWNEKTVQTITWASRGIGDQQRLSLFISVDDGASWQKIANSINNGLKNWKIPKNRFGTKNALIKLCIKKNEAICDRSDDVFTINQAPVAHAGFRQKVIVGTTILLDGTNS
jgi:hypothetical protein